MGTLAKGRCMVFGTMAGVVAIAMVVVFLPQQKKLSDLHTQTEQKYVSLEQANREAAVVPVLFQEVEDMKARYKDFDRSLPRQQDLGTFLGQISGKVRQEGLSGQLIEPGNPISGDLFHTLPINMRFTGDYVSTGTFLKKLHEMERLARVQRLKISRKDYENPDAPLDIELQINIYFTES